ncbi:MAG TPA: DUF362 domain-containing protein [Pirellulales bacterium]|nr:DUF362 domain-containing protein [Pirellulales bacterium]
MTPDDRVPNQDAPPAFDRRALLIGTGVAATAGLLGYTLLRSRQAGESVFIARNQRYDGPLEQTIADGLLATGLEPSLLPGKRVLLKPNMVEPSRLSPQMTTHPAMVLATAEVFRRWGATVLVGEAPGHLRDTEMALYESRIGEALSDGKIDFADLNYEEVAKVGNRGRRSPLDGFYFPRAVVEADLVVSMPKMKTHHWVGITVSMKNLYGTLPGCKYGWPKNVLHHAGIPETVVDINASLPKAIAVVDAITCMEGDGPIMGSAKPMGLVIVGTNPTAVDATCARIMGIDPTRVTYLALAGGTLGPLDDRLIRQVGEPWQQVASPFEILDRPHLRGLRLPGVLTS